MEWTMTIEGRDEYGEVQRAQLRIEKQFGKLTSGEIGLSIDDGKRIMSTLQEFVVKQELATYAQARRVCPSCERLRPVKDYTIRKIRTVFGTVEVKNTIYHRVRIVKIPHVVIGDEMRVPRTWLETQSAFEGVIGLCQECQSPPSAVPPKILISAAVVGVGAWFATNFLGKLVVAVREKRREAIQVQSIF